jgi:2-polyprenyl-3-methyl-5-hydroxy-6-metoxy-1,4-benzoquinol methylase
MDIRAYNRQAWDKLVESGDRWTVPVTADEILRAKVGEWQIVLTPTKPVPKSWFPDLPGTATLCLASGGGQQGPILAAAGAQVTVLDASPRQLEQDRYDDGESDPLSKYLPTFIATRAERWHNHIGTLTSIGPSQPYLRA